MKRSTPLRAKTPMKRKRDTPRRNEGRITHGRIKRPRVSKTQRERDHMQRIAAMPCLGCARRPVEVHHLMHAPGKRCRRDHRYVVPLCAECHRGKTGVHGLGSERLWGERRGIDLAAWAIEQWLSGDSPTLPEQLPEAGIGTGEEG